MPAEANLADDVVREAEGLVAQSGRQVGVSQIEEDTPGVLEPFLLEEQLAIHLDADPYAVRQGSAGDAANGHDAGGNRLGGRLGFGSRPRRRCSALAGVVPDVDTGLGRVEPR